MLAERVHDDGMPTSRDGDDDFEDRGTVLRERRAQISQRIEQLRDRQDVLSGPSGTDGSTVEEATQAQEHAERSHEYAQQAHELTVARHEQAAEAHQRVAEVLDRHGQPDKAQEHRQAAKQDVDAATEHQQAARDE